MCAVSAMVDHYRTQYPIPYMLPPIDFSKYLQDLEEASKVDVANGEPDCSDAEKRVWREKAIEGIRQAALNDPLLREALAKIDFKG